MSIRCNRAGAKLRRRISEKSPVPYSDLHTNSAGSGEGAHHVASIHEQLTIGDAGLVQHRNGFDVANHFSPCLSPISTLSETTAFGTAAAAQRFGCYRGKSGHCSDIVNRLLMTRMYGPAVRCKSLRRDSGERSCINVSGL